MRTDSIRKGFATVELVAGGIIIVALVILLIPVLSGYSTASENKVLCYNNLKSINLAFLQYRSDHDEKFPIVSNRKGAGWVEQIQPYLGIWELFRCPSSQSQALKTSDYFFNARLSGKRLVEIPFPNTTIILGDGPDDSPLNYTLSDLPEAWRKDRTSPSFRHIKTATYAFLGGRGPRWLKPTDIAQGPSGGTKPTFFLQ